MKNCHKPRFSIQRRVALWSLAFACGLFVVYLISRQMETRPVSLSGCESEIPRLRELAAVDIALLAEMLDQSVSAIPAGEFLMGSIPSVGNPGEHPQHNLGPQAEDIQQAVGPAGRHPWAWRHADIFHLVVLHPHPVKRSVVPRTLHPAP